MLNEEFITELIGLGEFEVVGGEIKQEEVEIEVEQWWEVALCSLSPLILTPMAK